MTDDLKREAREYTALHYLSFDGLMPLEDVYQFIDRATLTERQKCADLSFIHIKEAVLAERKRCAEIARNYLVNNPVSDQRAVYKHIESIATAIEKGDV